jgi:hypothetical protein
MLIGSRLFGLRLLSIIAIIAIIVSGVSSFK